MKSIDRRSRSSSLEPKYRISKQAQGTHAKRTCPSSPSCIFDVFPGRLCRRFGEPRETVKEEAPAEPRQRQEEAEALKFLQLVDRRTFLAFEIVEPEPSSQRRSLSEPPLQRACEKGLDGDEAQEEMAAVRDYAYMQAGKMWHPADNPFEPPSCTWEPRVPSKPVAFQLQRAVHVLDGPVQWELYTSGSR